MRRLLMLAMVAIATLLMVQPVAAQPALVDPGLDAIMKLKPAGFQRAERDRLPEGPMTAATFNAIGVTAVTTRDDSAAFYGASYERADGAVVVFLGMSTSSQRDGQVFADGVVNTMTNRVEFDAGVANVTAVEGESIGARAVAIAFARNGRGFAVLSFGATARADATSFVDFVVEMAAATPLRPDAKTEPRLRPVAVAVAAIVALAIAVIAVSWRFVRRRHEKMQGLRSMAIPDERARRPERSRRQVHIDETMEHSLPAAPSRSSPRPTPRHD